MLTLYPIGIANERELCDGESMGPEMEVVVRCPRCSQVEDEMKHNFIYLQRKHKVYNSKNISKKKNRRMLYNQLRNVELSLDKV